MARTSNEILVDAYSHLIDVSLNNDLETNRAKVKEYILADTTWKRLFKALSYNTFCFLENPFGYRNEETFSDEDFILLYAIGVIDEVTMAIDHEFDEAIQNCENKDKIIPYLKLQTGIKGLIDLYGYVDDETLFEKAQYAFDSEIFEIEVLDVVDASMFKEKTAPLIAAFAYQENGHFIRIELKNKLNEFLKLRQNQDDDLPYADFTSDEILYFSSSFKVLDNTYTCEMTPGIKRLIDERILPQLEDISENQFDFEIKDIIDVKMFLYNYPNWIYKGHTAADLNSYNLMKEF